MDILGSEFSICYINCQFRKEDLEDCGKYWDFYWDDILESEFSICYINCKFREDLEDCGKYWDFYWDDILESEDDILESKDDILGSEDDILGSENDILGSEDDILGSEFSICYINCQFREEDLEDCGKYWNFYWDDILRSEDDILGSEDDILGSEDDILGSEFSICYINCQFGEEDLKDCGKYWDFEISVFYLFNTNGV
ncbi:hypothetical protein Glove_120g137 [Diversispora epigaea]|uniref:Uncharacterized protein n=1 Tax=Diversispora epigaea TaxID=1348612 RepID=A0A397J8S5_9GLOM|nr:hypothetical protein Glove_120g137 [Diversispora epigaea]